MFFFGTEKNNSRTAASRAEAHFAHTESADTFAHILTDTAVAVSVFVITFFLASLVRVISSLILSDLLLKIDGLVITLFIAASFSVKYVKEYRQRLLHIGTM